MKRTLFFAFVIFVSVSFSGITPEKPSTNKAAIVLNADMGQNIISRHIYGHFSEHLGHCIYGGYWVGDTSSIPNTNGIRNDVVAALKEIQIPDLRWPGGCFADEYHWKDGIGPREKRLKMINTHWGGVTEDNSFGTHEFMELCHQLNTEPYICANIGSGTVEEMSQWVEYLNSDNISPMTDLRKKNGRDKPWGVKFWGVGNESWGCGGNMTADYYTDLYRRYATFCKNYGEYKLLKIAGGANSDDYNWTETLMQKIPHRMMWGISLHHYTTNWDDKGPATGFGEDRYAEYMDKSYHFKDILDKHIAIMDRYDPEKKVALVVDEWGAWYNVEPGTNPGFLFQQNTMRDAFIAGMTLNFFNQRCDRIRMANIAQTINVLQALIFTKGYKIVLTPTYYVYDMYKVHQGATLLPLTVRCDNYIYGDRVIPALSASASKDKNGLIHISLVNIDPEKDMEITVDIRGADENSVTGRVLTSPEVSDYNSFENPDKIVPKTFAGAKINNGKLTAVIPAKSVVVLELK